MVLNKGGYVMINKAQDNVYELATSALTSGKPVLWYEDENTCYYIDTITKSGTDIILTKGGKTITIENDGDITESGDIKNHLYMYKVVVEDKDNTWCIACLTNTLLIEGVITNEVEFIRDYLYAGANAVQGNSFNDANGIVTAISVETNLSEATVYFNNYEGTDGVNIVTSSEGFKMTLTLVKQIF